MPKINKGYVSVLDYLKTFIGRPLPPKPLNLNPSRIQQLLGAFQPIADMGKDFIDTFKPYKTKFHHPLNDLLQPFRGIGNIAKSILNVIGAPLLFVGWFFKRAYWAIKSERGLFKFLKFGVAYNFYSLFSRLLEAGLSIIRGITQIAATPLVWFLKMPIRGIITLIKGMPKIQENSGMKYWVAEADKAFKSFNEEPTLYYPLEDRLEEILGELDRKLKKAEKRGQVAIKQEESQVTTSGEKNGGYFNDKVLELSNRLNLFRTATPVHTHQKNLTMFDQDHHKNAMEVVDALNPSPKRTV